MEKKNIVFYGFFIVVALVKKKKKKHLEMYYLVVLLNEKKKINSKTIHLILLFNRYLTVINFLLYSILDKPIRFMTDVSAALLKTCSDEKLYKVKQFLFRGYRIVMCRMPII